MLTKLYVDGFKNLLDLEIELGPFTCIAGPNATGKSNIFDAIQFLSLLADRSFMEAAQQIRSAGDHSFDIRSIFWNDAQSNNPLVTIAAEMIVPPEIEDDFGRITKPSITFLTYKIVLRYIEPDAASGGLGSIQLEEEELKYITKGNAKRHMRWPHSAKNFRNYVIQGRRHGGEFISTTFTTENQRVINLHQDGGSRGKPRPSNPEKSPRSLLSTITSSENQTILAAKREMQSWRQIALEPSAMRKPDEITDTPHVTEHGAHLAATLYKLSKNQGDYIFDDIASEAAQLTDIRSVAVDRDERRELLTLKARLKGSPELPARSLSDGTIRFLALCVMKYDEEVGRVLCMEEPENGIHPGKLSSMANLIRSLAVDPSVPPGPENPMRQVIVNTHSSNFISYQYKEDVLLASSAVIQKEGRQASTVRLSPMVNTWRAQIGEGISKTNSVPQSAFSDYLTQPEDALFSLDDSGL